MARRRRDLNSAAKAQLLSALAAFRRETLIPYSAKVAPTSDGYRQAHLVHDALLNWADTVAGRKDALLAPAHSSHAASQEEDAED